MSYRPWWPTPETERELRGDGTDTDIQPGRELLSDMGVSDSRGESPMSIAGGPRIDTTKTAKPSHEHEMTVGLYASPCTITREEWHRRNG